jgi:predicted ribosomally synthesized peptide with SipW-like signal peptide
MNTMDKDGFEISRRKVLAGIGGMGAASTGAGVGTSAFFSDREQFDDNRFAAGELDLGVAWQSNYSDWSEDEATSDAGTFFENTRTRTNVNPAGSGIVLSSVDCSTIPSGDLAPRTVVEVEDVKPGDFGFAVFKLGFCTANANTGYLWTNARMTNTATSGPNDENDRPEPEVLDPDESDPFGIEAIDGELGRYLRVRPFYASSANAFEQLFDFAGSGIDFAHSFFSTFDLDVASAPTLLDFTDALAQGLGMPLTGNPQDGAFELEATADGNFLLVRTIDDGGDVFSLLGETPTALGTGSANTILFGLAWGFPLDHANEIQTDSVAFDVGFYAEQTRHNTGLGSSIGGLKLDRSEAIGGGSGHTAATGIGSGTGYAVKVAEASFAGISGPTTVSDPDPNTALASGPHVVVGIHAPDFVGTGPAVGQAPPLDSLVGFASLAQGSVLSAAQVGIGTTTFTGLVDGAAPDNGALATVLQDESPVPITATLWHAFRQIRDPGTGRPIMGIAPGSPVRDVDGSFVQDEDVPVEFP